MHQDCEKILMTEEQLKERVRALGEEISKAYRADEQVIAVGILRGSVIFMADLVRQITSNVELEFMAVSSYGASSKTSGVVKILKDLDTDIQNKHVLIIEDIIDSGVTLSYLRELLLRRGPKSLKICTLMNKPDRRKTEVPVDYIGFNIPDEFVIGYGLDYDNKYRNLPYVGILKREIYE